jgi:hypothetical protein
VIAVDAASRRPSGVLSRVSGSDEVIVMTSPAETIDPLTAWLTSPASSPRVRGRLIPSMMGRCGSPSTAGWQPGHRPDAASRVGDPDPAAESI